MVIAIEIERTYNWQYIHIVISTAVYANHLMIYMLSYLMCMLILAAQ